MQFLLNFQNDFLLQRRQLFPTAHLQHVRFGGRQPREQILHFRVRILTCLFGGCGVRFRAAVI
jgi:hypothetical protein